MPDLIPQVGDKAYRKRRTIKLEGFDDEEYYAIKESERIDWMENNWKKHIKTSDGSGENNRSQNQPLPSGAIDKKDDPVLTMGQRIFKTRVSCNTHNQSGRFIFNVWLNEIIKYCIFLGVMTGCTLAYTSNNNYYFIGLMKNKFIDATGFQDVNSVGQLWDWLEGPFLGAVYDDKIEYNIMVGKPRLRMQRVRPDSCSVHEDFQDEIDICYDSYSKSAESREEFAMDSGGGNVDLDGAGQRGPFRYTDLPGTLFGYDFWGEALTYLQMYYAGGYIEYLPSESESKDQARERIEELKSKEWLSNGARVLLIDVQYYNGNINILMVVRMAFEIPATGGVVPTVQFRTLQHMTGLTGIDIYTIINECLFIIIVCYYIAEKIFEFRMIRRYLFKPFETKLFCVILLLSVAAIIFRIYKYATLDIDALKNCDPLESHKAGECYMINFSYWERQFENMVSVIVFLTWLNLYRFFSDFPSMAVFTKTFSRAGSDLMSFMLVYMVTYLAYAQLGVLIFGNELDGFRNVFHSIYTLFKIILGDFDFNAMQQTNRVLGPIYFLSYVFCVFFLLLNMFLAIISDTYSEVKADLSVSQKKYPISDHIKSIKNNFMKKMNCFQADSETMASAIRNLDLKDDQEINWESFRREMLKAGVPDDEIKDFFQQYDTDGTMTMDKTEFQRMKDSVDKLGKHSSDTATKDGTRSSSTDFINQEEMFQKLKKDFSTVSEFELLAQRVSKMESYFSDLISRVDGIILNIDQISQRKKQEKYEQIKK